MRIRVTNSRPWCYMYYKRVGAPPRKPFRKESAMSLPLASTIVAAGVNTRDKFDTGSAGVLSVVGISWPAGTDVDAVLAGTATPDTVHLSSDGRHYVAEWHTGAESAESVYVERWSPAGREFHGFVDAKSRKIVQAG